MLQAEGQVELAGRQTTILRLGGREEISEQLIKRGQQRRMRIEYLSPPRMAGEVYLEEGGKWFRVRPGTQAARIAPFPAAGNRRSFRQEMALLLRRNVDIRWIGTDVIAGRKAYVVEVKPLRRPFPWKKLWIDAAKGVRLKIEEFGPRGGYAATFFTEIDYHPAFRSDEFVPPAKALGPRLPASPPGLRPARLSLEEARALARQKGHRLLEPSYLPRGYEFRAAFNRNFRGRDVIVLRYTDGFTPISLFETPSQGPRPGLPPNCLSWDRNGVNCILIGNLPEVELKKIADSVR